MTTMTKEKTRESNKSFIVTSGGHRFRFIPEDVGYSVSEIGVRGVNTQGDTFEEALANAHDASRGMVEFREEMKAGAANRTRGRSAAKRRPARLPAVKQHS
jgi:predicted RNase H-like HicB family nuclease